MYICMYVYICMSQSAYTHIVHDKRSNSFFFSAFWSPHNSQGVVRTCMYLIFTHKHTYMYDSTLKHQPDCMQHSLPYRIHLKFCTPQLVANPQLVPHCVCRRTDPWAPTKIKPIIMWIFWSCDSSVWPPQNKPNSPAHPLTNCTMPQTEIINPHREHFGPQIFILLASLNAARRGDVNKFLLNWNSRR